MTQSKDPSSESRYEDSRLREFLRRAAPILAAERGWNERSQLKIKSLAEELRLPESLYDQGVHKLREGKLRYEERFTVYERAFLKKLESDFRKSNTAIFTAAQEDHVIQIAVSDYQISPLRAREIIRDTAEQLGIRRVSKRDASEYLTSLIREQSTEHGQLSDDSRSRIRKAAEKWGLDEDELQSILASLQTSSSPPRKPFRTLATGLLAASILIGLSVGLYYWLSSSYNSEPISSSSEPEIKSAVSKPSTTSTLPAWWSLATTEGIEEFLEDHRADRISRQLLESDDVADRLQTYQEILDLSNSSESEFSIDCRLLFARLFQDETMEACRRMADMIQRTATLPSDQLPANPRAFTRGWQAFELLQKCYELTGDSPKQKLLEATSLKLTGSNSTTATSGLPSKQSFSDQQWRYLKTASLKNPTLAASLIEALSDLTREHLKTGNELEFSTSTNLLPIAPSTWKQMPRTLNRLVDLADEDQLRFLFLIQEQIGDDEFQSWLGMRMARKLELPTQGMTSSKITQAIAKRLNLPFDGRQIKSERMGQLGRVRGLEDFLNSDLQADPLTIAEATHYATIALLMTESENRSDPNLLAKANALIEKGVPSLKPGDANTTANLPIYRTIERRALPSDIRSQEAALRKLENATGNSDPINATAFERLARSAARFRDISWSDALIVASFVLEAKGDSERVEIEKNLGKLGHWPNLALALASQIQASDGELDQAMTCVSLLLDFQPTISNRDWRQELSEQILQRVALGLKYTAEIGDKDSRYEWNALRGVLVEHYRLRCALFGFPNRTVNSVLSPVELASLLTKATSPPQSDVDRNLKSNQYISQNEMQLFALQSRLAVDALVNGPVNPEMPEAETPAMAILQNELRILRSRTGGKP